MNQDLQNLEIKVENDGTTPQGRLTAAEWNILVAAVKSLDLTGGSADAASILQVVANAGYATQEWVTSQKYITSSALDNLAKNLVTLDTTQAITGMKDFTNGLKIGGVSVYKSKEGIVFVDGNLAVRGAITMYADNGQAAPSIWDGFPYDDVTIKRNAAGKFYAVGGGGSDTGGLDIAQLDEYLTTNGYATQDWVTGKGYITSSALEPYALKTAIPTSLKNPNALSWSGYSSGSYDGSTAQSITIPNNTNQLTNGAGFITGITGTMVTNALGYTPYNSSNPAGYITSSGSITGNAATSNRLVEEVVADLNNATAGRIFTMTSGYGTTDGNKPTTGWVTGITLQYAQNGVYRRQLAYSDVDLYIREEYNGAWEKWRKILTSTNFYDYALPNDGTAVAASKLATSRSIFGQSFDGSADVSGNIFPINANGCYYNENGISYHANKQYQNSILRVTSSYDVAIGGTTALDKLHVYGRGRFVMQRNGDHSSIIPEVTALTISANSASYGGYNTGIGFNALGDYGSLTHKNHIHAWIGLGGAINTAMSEIYPLVFAVNGSTTTGTAPIERMRITPDGNVGIGTTSPSQKLHVAGNLLATGAITMYYSSDKRLKQNIRKVDASKTLMSLGGVYQYEYIDSEVQKNSTYGGSHFGLIYQNVKGTALSAMCHEREDGYGALNYLDADFISLIAGATMESISEVEKLKKENKALRKRVEQLEKRIA